MTEPTPPTPSAPAPAQGGAGAPAPGQPRPERAGRPDRAAALRAAAVNPMRPWFWKLAQIFLKTSFKLFFFNWVYGRHRVPKRFSGPLLVTANHASTLDPPLVGACVGLPQVIMTKKELFDHPVLGWVIRSLGGVPVARGLADRKAMMTVAGLLEQGEALLIFPEGTRSPTGELQEGKMGVGYLAATTKRVRILPVWVEGTFAAWPRGQKFPNLFRRVRLHIGEPWSVEEWVAQNKATIEATTILGDPEGGESEGASEGAAAAKKRLYSALAKEIMRRIECVRDEALRGRSRPR